MSINTLITSIGETIIVPENYENQSIARAIDGAIDYDERNVDIIAKLVFDYIVMSIPAFAKLKIGEIYDLLPALMSDIDSSEFILIDELISEIASISPHIKDEMIPNIIGIVQESVHKYLNNLKYHKASYDNERVDEHVKYVDDNYVDSLIDDFKSFTMEYEHALLRISNERELRAFTEEMVGDTSLHPILRRYTIHIQRNVLKSHLGDLRNILSENVYNHLRMICRR